MASASQWGNCSFVLSNSKYSGMLLSTISLCGEASPSKLIGSYRLYINVLRMGHLHLLSIAGHPFAFLEDASGTQQLPSHGIPSLAQELDLLNPNSPVYNAGLDADIRGLQKFTGPLCQGPNILSGLTKQQHAWYLDNMGKSPVPLPFSNDLL